MEAANVELLAAFATLYESAKYSDLIVQCGDRSFPVHKVVVCSRSHFFDGACSHPWKESVTGIIDLSEDDHEAVEHMIHYFYYLDYLRTPSLAKLSCPASPASMSRRSSCQKRRPSDLVLAPAHAEDPLLAQAQAQAISSPDNSAPASPLSPSPHYRTDYFSPDTKAPPTPDLDQTFDESLLDSYESDCEEDECDAFLQPPNLVVHAKVYAIAEKYGITGLKDLARSKFAAQAEHYWSLTEFADSIPEVYETTVDSDRGLRDVVIQSFREHPQLARSKDMELVVRDTPGLAWELFRLGWGLPVF
ncbi:uncharacterized protein IWZ02DRAFT_436663 [Phyllosticta citriasiana]|uniref:BTB domain-containing protein n=1 Tax=Phyllosticta citriasiana TaxID=595635 RepID=A0ABR1KJS1_9PEZI